MEPMLEFYWAFRALFAAKSKSVAPQSPVRSPLVYLFYEWWPENFALAFIHLDSCYWGRSLGLVFSCLSCAGRILCHSAWSRDIPSVRFSNIYSTSSNIFFCFRYHVGESMIPSMRHFLRFIDADDKFESFGFVQKVSFSCLSLLLVTESDGSSTVPRSS